MIIPDKGQGVLQANYLADELLQADVADGYQHRFVTPILDFRFRLENTKKHVALAQQELGWGAKPATVVGG